MRLSLNQLSKVFRVKVFLLILSTWTLYLPIFSVFATCYSPDGKKYYPNARTTKGLLLEKEDRKKYAEEFLKQTKLWDLSLPTLSPSENAWLDKELASSFKRHYRATESKEYQIRIVKSYIEQNQSILEEILTSNSLNIQREMFLWSVIASNLSSTDFIKSSFKLIERYSMLESSLFGISEHSWHGVDHYRWISEICVDGSHGVQYTIIIPYLRSLM